MDEMDQCILGSLSNGKGSFLIAAVYASTNHVGRRELWQFLQQHCNKDMSMIVGRDFNCVLNQGDKKGGKPFVFNSSAQELWDCMLQCDLHKTKTMARKILPFVLTHHLARVASDHAPNMLHLLEKSPSSKPLIRFEDTWVSYHQTWRIVKAKRVGKHYGTAAKILNNKCRKSLRALFFWSKNKLKELNEAKL
ncbi:hypothetical protein M5K25_005744 [Dendrobium thyrsiflorum]|uniref:Uncharacterized protein n=1 Tax=Dendrobium thyrsiflorum TaxID=117978 RepID=A0ABD0VIJ5_DENTH